MSIDLFTNDLGFQIPPEAVQKLKEDARKAEETAKRYADIAASYNRKLSAIRELAPELFTEGRQVRAITLEDVVQAPTAPPVKTVIDAVVEAVELASRPLLPKEIRAAIVEQGDGALLTNENYLYTAIKRAADNGRISRIGDAYITSQREGPGE